MLDDYLAFIEQAREATDLAAMEPELKETVSARHAEAFAKTPAGDNEVIAPSLTDPDIWKVEPDRFVVGTRVPFAPFYAKWREANLGEPLIYLDNELADRIGLLWFAKLDQAFK